MNNDLFRQIQSWSISNILSIKNISKEELSEAKVRVAKGDNISTKQHAVINDILANRLKKAQYATTALKYYAVYIRDLIETFEEKCGGHNCDINHILEDINSSFVRCYIYKDINKSESHRTWRNILESIYDFLLKYRDQEGIYIEDTIICFLLLEKSDKKFQEVLSIYYDKFLERYYYDELKWVFGYKYPLEFVPDHLFCSFDNSNNLKNIINDVKSKINKYWKQNNKLSALKELVRDSFLSQYHKLYTTNNGFCSPIPDWINNILTDHDRKKLKNYYKSMSQSSPNSEQYYILDEVSVRTLEQIKKSNDLGEIIQLIISMSTDGFIAENMNTWEHLTGPGMPIIQPIKSVTGEVKYNSAESIKHQKLNALYNQMFDAIPEELILQEEVVNLIKKWLVLKPQFHQTILCYLTSILHPDTPEWQRKANINQVTLIIEQILLSIDPDEYKTLTNNNKSDFAELKGAHFENFVKKLIRNTDSSEAKFLLGAFRDHRNKIAHGNTYQDFGNCYFTLVNIIKVFCMKLSDFNLPKE